MHLRIHGIPSIIVRSGAGRGSSRCGPDVSVLLNSHPTTAAGARAARSSRRRRRRRHRISARSGGCAPPPRRTSLRAPGSVGATRLLPRRWRRGGIATSHACSARRRGRIILDPPPVPAPRRGAIGLAAGGFAIHDAHGTALQQHHPFARAGRSTQKLHDRMAGASALIVDGRRCHRW